jgi:hypothetical protein
MEDGGSENGRQYTVYVYAVCFNAVHYAFRLLLKSSSGDVEEMKRERERREKKLES